MSNDVVKVRYEIEDAYSSKIKNIDKETKNLDVSLKDVNESLGKIALASSAFAAIGVAGIVKAIKAWDAQYVAQERLSTSLKNQGILSKEYAEGLFKIASNLQEYANIADETALPVIQQLTDAFGKEVLEQKSLAETQELVFRIMDIATARGIDFETVMRGVSNATQGQTGSLSRYGVVLGEVNSKADVWSQLMERTSVYAGQAGIATQTFSGQIIALMLSFDDAFEPMGKFIQDALKPYVTIMKEIVKDSISWLALNASLIGSIMLVGTAIMGTLSALSGFGFIITGLVLGMNSFMTVIAPLGVIFAKLSGAFATFTGFIYSAVVGLGFLTSSLALIVGTVIAVGVAITSLGDKWDSFFESALNYAYEFSKDFAYSITNGIITAFETAWDFVTGGMKEVWDSGGVIYKLFGNFGKAVTAIFELIGGVVTGIWDGIIKSIIQKFSKGLDYMTDAYNKIAEKTPGMPIITTNFSTMANNYIKEAKFSEKVDYSKGLKDLTSSFVGNEAEKQADLKRIQVWKGGKYSEDVVLPNGSVIRSSDYEALKKSGQLENMGVISTSQSGTRFTDKNTFRPIQINVTGGVLDNKNTAEALAKEIKKVVGINDRVGAY